MKKKVKLLIVTMVSVIMAAMISSPVIAAPKVDFDKMEKCILKFFTPIYESMLAESTTCFSLVIVDKSLEKWILEQIKSVLKSGKESLIIK